MVEIRSNQRDVLVEAQRKAFVKEVVTQLRRHFMVDAELAGNEALRALAWHGLKRAEGRGFTIAGHISRFITWSLMLGSHFDSDPQIPWAAAALGSAGSASVRLERLEAAAYPWLNEVAGPSGEHYRRMLVRARRWCWPIQVRPARPALADHLKWLFPEKLATASPRALARLIGRASEVAQQWDLANEHGRGVVSALMLALGTHVLRDPLHVWIRDALDAPKASMSVRAELLHVAMCERLDRAQELLGERTEQDDS